VNRQPLRFALVGGVNTALDLTLFTGLTTLVALSPERANVISYGAGILLSFVLNRKWTFESNGEVAEQFTRFIVVSLAALLLSTFLVGGLVQIMPAVVAKILSLPVMFLWSYSMTRRFVFWRES
jgi:putative flippase GtrA